MPEDLGLSPGSSTPNADLRKLLTSCLGLHFPSGLALVLSLVWVRSPFEERGAGPQGRVEMPAQQSCVEIGVGLECRGSFVRSTGLILCWVWEDGGDGDGRRANRHSLGASSPTEGSRCSPGRHTETGHIQANISGGVVPAGPLKGWTGWEMRRGCPGRGTAHSKAQS